MSSEPIYVIKADGKREVFDSAKLEQSLKHAGAPTKTVEEILNNIRDSIIDDMTTHDIYARAFELLHKEGKHMAVRYSLKRAIMDLGPSGFPFEDFIAEVFRNKGFETLTGQTVQGFCVEHEIDVVAWNKERLMMIEAKFHNQLGIKSDLKIALYVKARADDLYKVEFDYGGKRKLNEFLLVTNTKFTSTAIEYGSCQGGLKMIGWNYPPVGNLHDMILEAKLHPLTCLTTLSGFAKKELLKQGIVLCKTLSENHPLLDAVGLTVDEKQKVIEEINSL